MAVWLTLCLQVGYGDIAPDEDFSRMLMTCIILAGFAILPRQVSSVVHAWW